MYPHSTTVNLEEKAPPSGGNLGIKLKNAEGKQVMPYLMPKVVFPTDGIDCDSRRGVVGKATVQGFVPHFWLMPETTDNKIVNTKKRKSPLTSRLSTMVAVRSTSRSQSRTCAMQRNLMWEISCTLRKPLAQMSLLLESAVNRMAAETS